MGTIGLSSAITLWIIVAGFITIAAYRNLSELANPDIQTVTKLLSDKTLAGEKSELRRVRYMLFPLTVPGRVLGWVPWLGHELEAPELILERAEADIDTARLFAGGLRDASDQLRGAEAAFRSGKLPGAIGPLRSAADAIEPAALTSIQQMESREDDAYWFVVSDRLQRRIVRLESILLPSAKASLSGADVLRHTADALEVTSQLGIVGEATASVEDPGGYIEQLTTAVDLSFGAMGSAVVDMQDAFGRLGHGNSEFGGIMELLSVTAHLAESGQQTAGSLRHFLECDGGLLEPDCSIDLLLNSLVGPGGTVTLATEATDLLAGTVAPQLLKNRAPGAAALQKLALELQKPVASASDALNVIYSLLGAQRESDMLILGVSPDELRPAGGFVSSAWTAHFEKGALGELTYYDVVEFDKTVPPGDVQPPPESLRTQMNAGALYLRDVTWTPQVPDVGNTALEIAESAGYGSHEDVMVMTLWFITKLTDGIGGVVVDGKLIDGDQILKVIQDGTDEGGREFLSQLLPNLLQQLSGPAVKDDPVRLAAVAREVIKAKDVTFYSSDGSVQAAILRLGWGGALPAGTEDRVAIFDSNIGWNKSDRHVERSFEYLVTLNPTGTSSARLRLSYAMPKLDNFLCTEQATVLTRVPYDELTSRCNWNFVRAYVAYGSVFTSHQPLPALPDSMAVADGSFHAGDDTFQSTFDQDGTYFSAVIRIGQEETKTIEVEYRLPSYVIHDLGDGEFLYSLNLVAQPGARGRDMSVVVKLPESATIVDTNIGTVSANTVTIDQRLVSDITVNVRFTIQ